MAKDGAVGKGAGGWVPVAIDGRRTVSVFLRFRSFPFRYGRTGVSGKRKPQAAVSGIGAAEFSSQVPFRDGIVIAHLQTALTVA